MALERQYREQIVRYGRMLHERGFVAATDGNLSVRLSGNRILATPTCMSKGCMRASDLVVVDAEGHLVSGKRNVSSEIGMHLLIYRLRPDVQGIVHAHPPTAPGFDAILMSNHGVVTYGGDLEQAYMKMETVEHFAKIALVTHQIGHQQPLGATELEKLVVARAKYMQGGRAELQPSNGHGRKKAAAESEGALDTLPRRASR